MRNHPISDDRKGLSLSIDIGEFFMGINYFENLSDREAEEKFIWMVGDLYSNHFDEVLIHEIVYNAVMYRQHLWHIPDAKPFLVEDMVRPVKEPSLNDFFEFQKATPELAGRESR